MNSETPEINVSRSSAPRIFSFQYLLEELLLNPAEKLGNYGNNKSDKRFMKTHEYFTILSSYCRKNKKACFNLQYRVL